MSGDISHVLDAICSTCENAKHESLTDVLFDQSGSGWLAFMLVWLETWHDDRVHWRTLRLTVLHDAFVAQSLDKGKTARRMLRCSTLPTSSIFSGEASDATMLLTALLFESSNDFHGVEWFTLKKGRVSSTLFEHTSSREYGERSGRAQHCLSSRPWTAIDILEEISIFAWNLRYAVRNHAKGHQCFEICKFIPEIQAQGGN